MSESRPNQEGPQSPTDNARAATDRSSLYDRIGGTYTAYRQPDPRLAAQISQALGQAKTVADVGAGTGSYESPDRQYIPIEPSETMIRQRPQALERAVRGVAERLPLADNSCDAVQAILTVHHWNDLSAGIAEMRRVSRGPIVILTWDHAVFARFWMPSEYLPEAAAYDRTLATLDSILPLVSDAKVVPVPVPRDCTDGMFACYWRRPEMYLDPGARAAISGIAMLPNQVVDRMVTRLRADLRSGEWHDRHADLFKLDSYDTGYRLVIA